MNEAAMLGSNWPVTLETAPRAIGAAVSRAVRLEDEASWARFEAVCVGIVETQADDDRAVAPFAPEKETTGA